MARQYKSRFLNKVRYEYVPAIRSMEYYGHILSKLQTRILRSETEEDQFEDLIGEVESYIDDEVENLKNEFERITGIESSINAADDIESLFRSFGVKTTSSEGYEVPLLQRRDGIQSQYIVSILNYISSLGNTFDIWGIEEPENSLEYSRVKEFCEELEDYRNQAQVMVTTHSPAITSINHDFANHYRVYREEDMITNVNELEGGSEDLESDLGIEGMMSDIYENYKSKMAKLERIKSERDKLSKELERDIIVVEGKTDKKIIEEAYNKIYAEETEFEIRKSDMYPKSASETFGGADAVRKIIEGVHPDRNSKVIAIFDRDSKGISKFDGLSQFTRTGDGADIKVHISENAYAMLLPSAVNRPNFSEAENMPIELLFDDEVIDMRDENNEGLEWVEEELNIRTKYGVKLDSEDIVDKNELHESKYKSIGGNKVAFANNIVPNLPREKFKNFVPLFLRIEAIRSESL